MAVVRRVAFSFIFFNSKRIGLASVPFECFVSSWLVGQGTSAVHWQHFPLPSLSDVPFVSFDRVAISFDRVAIGVYIY